MSVPERQIYKQTKYLSCGEALTPLCDLWCGHRTKNHTLVIIRGKQVSCFWQPGPWVLTKSQDHDTQRQKARAHWILAPYFFKLSAGCQWLTMSFWDPGWFISTRSVTAWDQLLWEDVQNTWDCPQGYQQLGTGKGRRHRAKPDQNNWTWKLHKIYGPPGMVHS